MKPMSLSHLLDSIEKIKAKIKIEPDTAIWMNKNTSEILKRRYPLPTGPRADEALLDLGRHTMGIIEIYIDNALPDRVIESGVCVSEFEKGKPFYKKLVRHRQTL